MLYRIPLKITVSGAPKSIGVIHTVNRNFCAVLDMRMKSTQYFDGNNRSKRKLLIWKCG